MVPLKSSMHTLAVSTDSLAAVPDDAIVAVDAGCKVEKGDKDDASNRAAIGASQNMPLVMEPWVERADEL